MPNYQYLSCLFQTAQGENLTQIAYGDVYSNILNEQSSGSNRPSSLVAFATITVDTPTGKVVPSASINASTDLFTLTNHGLYTGLVGQWTTSSALPGGLSLSTDYFIIRVDANTFRVATTLANALANTYVNLTNAGSGNQTFTATAIDHASVFLQGSFDETNWVSVPYCFQDVTESVTVLWEIDYTRYASYRFGASIQAGMMNVSPMQIGYRN